MNNENILTSVEIVHMALVKHDIILCNAAHKRSGPICIHGVGSIQINTPREKGL